jgi:hypothetical protein
LVYRWDLENLVYMCRVCHNEATQKPLKLYLKLQKEYPHLWAWGENQPPLMSQPISTASIAYRLSELQEIAKTLGVKYE